MACKRCGSIAQEEFDGEVYLCFTDLKRAKLPSVFVCERLWVCLDCGFAEQIIPKPELALLRKGLYASSSSVV
jgi:hypothetical protein